MKTHTQQKFKDEKVANNAASSIFFLRFLCPALLDPQEYEILQDLPSNVRPALKNMSKGDLFTYINILFLFILFYFIFYFVCILFFYFFFKNFFSYYNMVKLYPL